MTNYKSCLKLNSLQVLATFPFFVMFQKKMALILAVRSDRLFICLAISSKMASLWRLSLFPLVTWNIVFFLLAIIKILKYKVTKTAYDSVYALFLKKLKYATCINTYQANFDYKGPHETMLLNSIIWGKLFPKIFKPFTWYEAYQKFSNCCQNINLWSSWMCAQICVNHFPRVFSAY